MYSIDAFLVFLLGHMLRDATRPIFHLSRSPLTFGASVNQQDAARHLLNVIRSVGGQRVLQYSGISLVELTFFKRLLLIFYLADGVQSCKFLSFADTIDFLSQISPIRRDSKKFFFCSRLVAVTLHWVEVVVLVVVQPLPLRSKSRLELRPD